MNMNKKKTLSLLLIFSMVLGLVACGGGEVPEPSLE